MDPPPPHVRFPFQDIPEGSKDTDENLKTTEPKKGKPSPTEASAACVLSSLAFVASRCEQPSSSSSPQTTTNEPAAAPAVQTLSTSIAIGLGDGPGNNGLGNLPGNIQAPVSVFSAGVPVEVHTPYYVTPQKIFLRWFKVVGDNPRQFRSIRPQITIYRAPN